jgi:hypothetical protein
MLVSRVQKRLVLSTFERTWILKIALSSKHVHKSRSENKVQ